MNIKEIRRQNLVRAIDSAGSIESLASITQTNPKYISQLKNGVRQVGDKFAEKMEMALGLQPGDWDRHSEPKDLKTTSPGLVTIPRLDVAASFGAGIQGVSMPDVVERITINTEYLRKNVNFTSISNLALITGYGDSMAETFCDGDLLLVDTGVKEIKIDAVYTLLLGDELYIKRVQRIPNGGYLMISDNKNYPPFEIKNPEADGFLVVGRVLLIWNARRL